MTLQSGGQMRYRLSARQQALQQCSAATVGDSIRYLKHRDLKHTAALAPSPRSLRLPWPAPHILFVFSWSDVSTGRGLHSLPRL